MLGKEKNADLTKEALGNRIMIVGCGGAGKSTFAAKLGELTGLPVYHLDRYFWRDWQETPEKEWTDKVTELASGDRWIIDGNYSATMEIRLERADTLIWLDYGTLTCLSGVLKRVSRNKGKVRPYMGEGCYEKFDWSFIKWVLTFRGKPRKRIESLINKHSERVRIITFKNRKAAGDFFANVFRTP